MSGFANSAAQQQKLSVLLSQMGSPRGHKMAATGPGVTGSGCLMSGERPCLPLFLFISRST